MAKKIVAVKGGSAIDKDRERVLAMSESEIGEAQKQMIRKLGEIERLEKERSAQNQAYRNLIGRLKTEAKDLQNDVILWMQENDTETDWTKPFEGLEGMKITGRFIAEPK